MTFSLYDATIPSYLQMLGSVSALVAKAEEFCTDKGCEPSQIIEARLAEDMLPFSYQAKSVVAHSLGAIEGVRKGVFSPDRSPPPGSFEELGNALTAATEKLEAMDRAEIDSFLGRDMKFVMGEMEIPFTAENFLLSFSLPNFYFHAATVYDILRWKGLELGKRDFLGKMRIKKS